MNAKAIVAAAAITVLLAGCASGASVTVEQSDVAIAKGKDAKTLECTDKAGSVTYSVTGTAGKIHITVRDPLDAKLVDKEDISGSASGTIDNLHGVKGTWTLGVERSDFSGDYSVTLSC